MKLYNDIYKTEWDLELVDWKWDLNDEGKIHFHGLFPDSKTVFELSGYVNGTEAYVRNWNDGSDGSTVIDYPIPAGVLLDLPKAK